MDFYKPEMRTAATSAGEPPPLVSAAVRRRIRLGVATAHLLFIGIPLAVMCVAAWLAPAPKKVIVLDMVELPSAPPSAVQAPAPPSVQAPSKPDAPKPFANAPLAPSVVDTAPKPLPDPPRPPKPAKSKEPAKQSPKPAEPKPAKSNAPAKEPQPAQPTWTAVDPSTLGSRTPSQPSNAGTPGTGTVDPTYDGKLYRFVKLLWDDLIPSKVQLGGSKPSATISVTIAPDGTVRNAVIKTPSGVAAMDAAVRRLCDKLKSGKAPRPNGETVERDIILECN